MVLNKDQITDKGLISEGFLANSLRNCGYDITIATIFAKNAEGQAEESVDEFDLDPQGVALVVSQEKLTLPMDICGHAIVKTSLCREGVLAINIGILDPGWQGPISSILMNFGKTTYRLKKNEPFLRLTFHEMKPPKSPDAAVIKDRQVYTDEVKRQFGRRLSASFMDFERATEKVSQKYIQGLRDAALKYLPIASLFLALLTIFMNWAVISLASRAMPQDVVQAKTQVLTSEIKQDNQQLHDENSRLHQEIKDLRDRVDDLAKPKKKP
jgi:deoxycytidine triphosphate deaminase